MFLWFSYRSLFNQNAHFTLKHIFVRSGGWWDGKSEKVEELLSIHPGSTNIFSVDLAEERKQLAKEPSIESVSIERILPDTLVFKINERIPIAFLYHRKPTGPNDHIKVLDENGMVMLEDYCINVDKDLPVITGVRATRSEVEPGHELKQVLPAIRLIDLAYKYLPEMKILRISLSDPQYFNTSVYLPDAGKVYTLYLNRKRVEENLNVLTTLFGEVQRSNPNAKMIDMRYKGQAVVK